LDHKEFLYNQTQIISRVDEMLKLIDTEINKYPDKDSRRVFISGFSQGCFTSSAIFLRYTGKTPLGGVMCMSGM